MKTARYGVESIVLWCPYCFEILDDPGHGSQVVIETDMDSLPSVLDCPYCEERFKKPAWPAQRAEKTVQP